MSATNKQFFLILFLIISCSCSVSAARTQFQQWYPEWAYSFIVIRNSSCNDEYNLYLHGKHIKHIPLADGQEGVQPGNQLAQPLVNCILGHASEFIKSSLGAAQVVLGLTPSVLAVLGPSVEEIASLSVVGRRPTLALCIGLGSPTIFPLRAFNNQDPLEVLRNSHGRLPPPLLDGIWALAVSVLEYLVVFGAIANIAHVCTQLGLRVVCSFAPQLTFLFLLWAFLAALIHIVGTFALYLRIKASHPSSSKTKFFSVKTHIAALEKRQRIDVELTSEGYGSLFLSYLTAIFTVALVIYGTLIFSSVLFISVKDAVVFVIGRFCLSVMCCRIVLMYELAGLRSRVRIRLPPGDRDDSDNVELIPTTFKTDNNGWISRNP